MSSKFLTACILVLVLINSSPSGATVEVLASSGCRLGVIYQPTSCTRCVCALFNFMLCRQTCFGAIDESPTTPRPMGSRPSGPTIVPILIPFLNRRPFNLAFDGKTNATLSHDDVEILNQYLKEIKSSESNMTLVKTKME